jgi:hypothetical protein
MRNSARRKVAQARLLAMLAIGSALTLPGSASAGVDLFVADPGSNRIIRVDADTGTQNEVSANGSLVDPMGIAVAADGELIVADATAFGNNGGVIRVNRTTGAQSTVASGGSFKDPTGVAIAPNGDILVADREALGGDGAVIRVNPISGAQSTVSSGGSFKEPSGVALAANGDILVADSYGGVNTVFRVNPATGVQSVVASGAPMANPTGIAVDSAGMIFVGDPGAAGGAGALIRINPGTGAKTVVSGAGSMQDPSGVVVHDGALLVADQNSFSGLGAVLEVSPMSGGQTVVSMANLFTDPFGIARPPDGDSDAVPDYSDNCPAAANPAQEDRDSDALGDACDPTDDRPAPPPSVPSAAPLPAPVQPLLPAPVPAPLPAPVLGETVNVQAVSGVVRISVPEGSARGSRFETLTGARQIPVGSQIDAIQGRIRMVTAGAGTGTTQTADFFDGRFKVAQRARGGGATELRLAGKLPRCRAAASQAAKSRKKRRLWGDGKGRFTTRGQRSAATVRGTKWLVEDTCAGTLTRVARGKVSVRDFVRRRTVTLRTGGKYMARNRRR